MLFGLRAALGLPTFLAAGGFGPKAGALACLALALTTWGARFLPSPIDFAKADRAAE